MTTHKQSSKAQTNLEPRYHQVVEGLKTEYRSTSKYFPLWQELKATHFIKVKLLEHDTFDLVKNKIIKLKHNDYYYMAALRLELGYQLELVFELNPDDSNVMLIKLKDTRNDLNLSNFN